MRVVHNYLHQPPLTTKHLPTPLVKNQSTTFFIIVYVTILICFFLGAFHLYVKFAVVLLWLSQSTTIFWGVMWPLHYRVTKTSGRIKYVHITIVAISFILPIIPIVSIQFSGGFGLFIPFPLFCSVNKTEDIFYGYIIPINLSVVFGTALLVITGWKIADFVSDHSNNPYRKLNVSYMLIVYQRVGIYRLTM